MSSRIALVIVACIALASIGADPINLAAAGREYKDLAYAKVDGTELRLDLYMPADVPSPSLVVWIHGGACSIGTKADPPRAFLDHGFAVASLDFRVHQCRAVPGHVHDIKAGIRFLRARAANTATADRIAFAGASSGAHLAT